MTPMFLPTKRFISSQLSVKKLLVHSKKQHCKLIQVIELSDQSKDKRRAMAHDKKRRKVPH